MSPDPDGNERPPERPSAPRRLFRRAGRDASAPAGVPAGAPEDVPSGEVGPLIERLAGEEDLGRAERGRLIGRLARALASSAREAGSKGVARGRWLTDVFAGQIAPRIPIRDVETLVRHHHGLTGDALADSLVHSASSTTMAVGAAGGALAAVEFSAPPLLLTVPAQVVAEALVVAAVEVKLVAELHEVYGKAPYGGKVQKTGTYVMAWARRRGVDPLKPGSLTLALGAAAKVTLRNRLLRLLGRHLTTLGPFLTGAVAGGVLNRQATKKLAELVLKDLRVPRPLPPGGGPARKAIPGEVEG